MWSKFFKRNGLVTPRGPNFEKAKPVTVNFDGSTIRFSAPKHSRESSVFREVPIKLFVESSGIQETADIAVTDWPKVLEVGYRCWVFKGDYFFEKVAYLNFTVLVYRVKPNYESFSLFNAKDFESTIREVLTLAYGNKIYLGRQKYLAPTNWQVINPEAPLVCFDVLALSSDPLAANELKASALVAALSDDCYLYVNMPYSVGNYDDCSITLEPLKKLSSAILNSFEVKLSETALAQKKRAVVAGSGKISSAMPSIKWTNPQQDAFDAAFRLWRKGLNLSELIPYGSSDRQIVDDFLNGIDINEQDGWDSPAFNYDLPANCPTELHPLLLKAMEEHGIFTDEDYKEFLIDKRYRRLHSIELKRPLSAAKHLVERQQKLSA